MILPGATYLITRRCTQRQFLLNPSVATNALVTYCLAVATARTGIKVHAFCFMSNHWHGVVTDPDARLPEFLEQFHRLLARSQNAALRRHENLWSSDKTSVVTLTTDDAIFDKIAYTVSNPTIAGLVCKPSRWPGVTSLALGKVVSAKRPNTFFDPRGRLPSSQALEISLPALRGCWDRASFARRLGEEVTRYVTTARQRLLREGRRFVGVKAILRQRTLDKPRTEPTRSKFRPRVSSLNRRARRQAIDLLGAFYRAYRAAWEAWRGGNRSAIFPSGTYALRVRAGVCCAPLHPT